MTEVRNQGTLSTNLVVIRFGGEYVVIERPGNPILPDPGTVFTYHSDAMQKYFTDPEGNIWFHIAILDEITSDINEEQE